MTELEMKILKLKLRIKKIEARKGAMKCPGVLNRLKSELNTLEKI